MNNAEQLYNKNRWAAHHDLCSTYVFSVQSPQQTEDDVSSSLVTRETGV